MTLVERPDLTKRTALSKSVLVQFDLCQTKQWFALHDPRPFQPIEKVTFGSCLDAAVEVVIKYARMGEPPDMARALAAASFVMERDGIEVELDEVRHALARFEVDVLPFFGWEHAITQASISAEIERLGPCNGHPDIVFPDEVWDVKATTGKNPKDPRSVELGFYAVLREAETGVPVRRVGYIEWRRAQPAGSLQIGKWVTPSIDVTPEFRRWATEKAAAYVNARRADEVLNRKATRPLNFSMTGGPAFGSLCSDCVYNPANGGPCGLAYQVEEAV